ncbi:MAG: DUF1460 domain-containing protein [Elusimicrobia bacterium]|nr:DUF1460 domain-containing protein [Elusimicrobiota bacterium]
MTGLLAALPVLLALAGEPSRFRDLAETELGPELARVHAAHPELAARLDAVSERFLGTPYRLGPLGEGEGGEFDRDPLVNFREADCTTFIEQVLGLSLEADWPRSQELLRKIRYRDGRVAYEARNHFPETDWIPNNIRAGFLSDVTRAVAGRRARWAFKTIDKRAWYLAKSTTDLEGFAAEPEAERLRRVERWRALGQGLKSENARLPYVPLEDLAEVLPRVPSGAIGNVVRESLPDKPVLVTHQVLLLQKPAGTIVRHAAYGKRVEDVPAAEYFARLKDAKWRVLGVNLNAVVGRPGD